MVATGQREKQAQQEELTAQDSKWQNLNPGQAL